MSVEFGEVNKYDQTIQLPVVDLVFTGPKRSLVDRVNNNAAQFTRNTIGTYVGADGLIKTAAAGELRYTYDPETGEELGLLVEESRTNVVKNSVDTSDTNSWVNNGVITTPNQSSPDGQNNATLIQQNTSSSTHSIDVGKSTNNLNNYYISFTASSICIWISRVYFCRSSV
jgi:hypothetical protein